MECIAADPAHFAEILNPTFTRVTELHLLKGFRHRDPMAAPIRVPSFWTWVPPPGKAECRDRQISVNDPKKGYLCDPALLSAQCLPHARDGDLKENWFPFVFQLNTQHTRVGGPGRSPFWRTPEEFCTVRNSAR